MASRFSRRKLVIGGVALGAGAIEAVSLVGKFDFRNAAPATSAALYQASLLALAGQADGAVIHIGHSTHLLSVAGVRFLTDPWFHDPAFGALGHRVGPAVLPEDIGALDCLLISHEHPDHMDPKALARLDKKATVLVNTEETAAFVRGFGFAKVRVMPEWSVTEVGGARITAVPAVHDCYEVGYVVEGAGRSVYFAGDTMLNPAMDRIAKELKPGFAILPVDGTKLFGTPYVMSPDDAVKAAQRLGVRAAMPTHGEATFTDPFASALLASQVEDSPTRFAEAMSKGLKDVLCHVPPPGSLLPIAAS